jgi:uncharacterized protein YndB with AHSA1/START domain
MFNILHRIGIKAPPGAVLDALATIDGLAGWWTSDTKGDAAADGEIAFTFEGRGFIRIKVLKVEADRVLWEVLEGPEEWIRTRIGWELKTSGDFTVILFSHTGWREPVEFMHHCTTKWAQFLFSLRAKLETGTGWPAPNDPPIGDWD